ncbi:MAG: endopeptidase La [Oscillospiraceae bacterium]|nr:endopeptidase La [Oscillospiraceae bacterium]
MNHFQSLPLLPVRGITVFPHMVIHFDVGRDRSVKALEQAMLSDRRIFLVTQRDMETENPNHKQLHRIGVVAKLDQILKLPGDHLRVMAEGLVRGVLVDIEMGSDFTIAHVDPVPIKRRRISAVRAEALARQAVVLFEEYAHLVPQMSAEVLPNVRAERDAGRLADYIAQHVGHGSDEQQAILEESNEWSRLEALTKWLTREIDILKAEHELQGKLRGHLAKNQRDYFLREQMRAIQAELSEFEGESAESGESDIDIYRQTIADLKFPVEIEEKLIKETSRLAQMHFGMPEAGVIRTYLDTVLELPWRKRSKDRLSLTAAEKTLNAEHYGMEKVKERVLEFLAVKRLAPDIKGQILCLVGPPGVGKTSIGMSIGRALNRKLARISLGGVHDEADIRGHRKTYIGAMPGRILQGVKQAGSKNCVLLLDEIDKLGHDFRGDPASALLEVLDPEQNHAFRDHYAEVPFDLSDVLFIATANTTETIPRPLLDRMEVIELTSYTDEEKLRIAKRHLLPKQLARHGLSKTNFKITDGAIREVISGYTRESGVRQFERQLAALCRKTAKRVAQDSDWRVTYRADTLQEDLGPRKYKPERLHGSNEVGVVNGLAWTSVGGELLEVEAGVMDGSGKIELTGNLGQVMKESARAALTYIRSRVEDLQIAPDFHTKKDVHVHFPEGAIPKDGPSAGITAATALISALTGRPIRRDLAMTGEISLRGRVLPIGGLKEKTMAAYRAGIRTVVIPADNESDLQDIDPDVRNALQFVAAAHMDDVLKVALRD